MYWLIYFVWLFAQISSQSHSFGLKNTFWYLSRCTMWSFNIFLYEKKTSTRYIVVRNMQRFGKHENISGWMALIYEIHPKILISLQKFQEVWGSSGRTVRKTCRCHAMKIKFNKFLCIVLSLTFFYYICIVFCTALFIPPKQHRNAIRQGKLNNL